MSELKIPKINNRSRQYLFLNKNCLDLLFKFGIFNSDMYY